MRNTLDSDNCLPIIKTQILKILATKNSNEAIKVFKLSLEHKDNLVKVEGLKLLTSIKNIEKSEAIELLISALQDDSSTIKITAIQILENIGTLDVLKALIQSSKSSHIDIYRPDIFQLSRKLAIKHQKSGSPLIPVYPELVGGNLSTITDL